MFSVFLLPKSHLLSLELQALISLPDFCCMPVSLKLFILFLLPLHLVFHVLYLPCVFLCCILLLHLEFSLLSLNVFNESLILFSHFYDFSEGFFHLLISWRHSISNQRFVVESLDFCMFFRINHALNPGFDLLMRCALPSLSIFAFKQEDAILGNLGHPQAVVYDAVLVPVKRIIQTKLVVHITVSEN